MSKFTIYHNPKCSKSRQTLELLKEKGIEPTVVEYLKEPLTKDEVSSLIKKLDVDSQLLIRKKEDLYKENKPSIETDADIAKAIEKFPKIMERPIVVCGSKAVIGRPPENVLALI